MIKVIVVSFNNTKHIEFVEESDLELKLGDIVVVENENGLYLATVRKTSYEVNKKDLESPLAKIVRIADKKDLKQAEDNKKISDKALIDARKLSKELELDMSFLDVNYNLDKSQLLFYFLSENRVDFRNLAKKLAAKYKTRIELRQIGVRDKAKQVGGLGPCGRFLCCNTFLTDFSSVSINMAKNQFLALNPSKINGVCGRLLCCLGYENDIYTELKKDLPKMGSIMETSEGIGKVVALDVFKKTYSVDLKEKGIREFNLDGTDASN